jgi:serine/threonine-protein kinase
MVTVVVDDRGRLVEFTAVPPQHDASAAAGSSVDWTAMFQAAGLQLSQFSEVAPQWTPRVYSEQRIAWEGPLPHRTDVRLRIEAASYRGRPAAFKVIGPWTRPSLMEPQQSTATQRVADAIGTIVVFLLLVGAVLLFRANVRSGRADRRGASRVALFLLAANLGAWALGARHEFDVSEEVTRFFIVLAFSLLNVGFTWLLYLALEPFVRRLSPDMLIGWSRLLAGQVRDPRVGRDVLIGTGTGVLFALVVSSRPILGYIAGGGTPEPQISEMDYFVGARYAIADLIRLVPNALQSAMLGTFFYVIALAIVRRRWIAATLVLAVVSGLVLAEVGGDAIWLSVGTAAVLGGVTMFVFVRFGLLAFATALYVSLVLSIVPLTLNPSRPHASVSMLALLVVATLAVYAFHVSRAGEGMLRRLLPQA